MRPEELAPIVQALGEIEGFLREMTPQGRTMDVIGKSPVVIGDSRTEKWTLSKEDVDYIAFELNMLADYIESQRKKEA